MITYHFNESDWSNAVPSCSSSDMSEELIERLEYARSLSGIAFRITSAYRSPEYEISKGRSGTSSHCKGVAVDIACYSDDWRYIIVQNLLRAGFIRIGISKTFIHADMDFDKKPCIWLYDNNNSRQTQSVYEVTGSRSTSVTEPIEPGTTEDFPL